MQSIHFFWLHIKKSAGTTVRKLLKPYYLEVERVNRPKNFQQATPEEFNDVLNNYRIILGDYQFKRCLYAKKFLYPTQWEDLFSFAFAREPTDRCISMFYYLFWKDLGFTGNLKRTLEMSLQTGKILYSTSYAFDVFLESAAQARSSESIYEPLGLHFTTHTAPMWDDITDEQDKVLLKKVYRLENLIGGINDVFEECGIEKKLAGEADNLNRNPFKRLYQPTKAQLSKIQAIYGRDYEVYESAIA